jgi:hypothetical protein
VKFAELLRGHGRVVLSGHRSLLHLLADSNASALARHTN